MKTVRDHIAGQSAVPAPPPGATHVLVWEPYGPSRSQWALGALDAPAPDDNAALMPGPADLAADALVLGVSYLLGYPVGLSSRIEAEDEVAYYVSPMSGGR